MIDALEIREVIQHALVFQKRLQEIKAQAKSPEPGWYPWDSFGTVTLFNELLTGRRRFLSPLVGSDPVLDIGCGDGDLAFLFESLGFRVCAVDHPETNYNRMGGVKALKRALGSKVRIAAMDIDRDARLPVARCGLALFLGILYHLKNPYGVLESLAQHARHCLLSTAVTHFAPGRGDDLSEAPAAFLAGRGGLRGDETNYWIFTERGLRNLIERTGWEICDWQVSRDSGSLLWGEQTDERAICLLRSRHFAPEPRTQLAEGWHVLENGAWRWTMGRFSIAVAPGVHALRLKVTVPKVLSLPVTLAAAGSSHMFDHSGDFECEFPVSKSGGEQTVEFSLDRVLPPDARDGRERGIVVRSVETVPKDSRR
jgi:SAM-dependent methyltransferase